MSHRKVRSGPIAVPRALTLRGTCRRLVRRALHAPRLRAGTIPSTPELALALACARHLTSSPPLLCRRCPASSGYLRGKSSRRAFDGGAASEELGFEVHIDALLADGADGRALVADLYFFELALKAALTLSSWSTSPCTLPRGAGCLGQGLCLRWPVSCVLDPFRARRE